MSLATRCTSCGTIFRVVQDQLKVSEGWVRCGRCQVVFSALEGLFDLEREAPPQRPPPLPLSPSEVSAHGLGEFVASQLPGPPIDPPVPTIRADDAIESRRLAPPVEPRTEAAADEGDPDFVDARFPSELPLDSVIDAPMEHTAAAVDDSEAAPATATATAIAIAETPAPEPDTTLAAAPPPTRRPMMQRWRERRRAARESAATSLLDLAPPGQVAESGENGAAEALPDDVLVAAAAEGSVVTPGFVRQAEDAARWQRPRVRASLTLLALLLAGLLAAQAGLQFRDTLAAHRPAWRPALEALCNVADCRIAAPRRIAALTVEASGLTRSEGEDAYRLRVVLLNRSELAVAPPSVELSLTDPSGALIARRALAPADFHLAASDAPVGTDPLPAGRETAWQARLGTGGVRVSGYTVELFYP